MKSIYCTTHPAILQSYDALQTDQYIIIQIRQTYHHFSKGSVLWHCTEGKDRCGLLCAVLLPALGTDRSAIMEDYLLTNRVNEPKAERYAQQMRAVGKFEMEAAAIRDIFLAKEAYLDAAFSAIDAQFSNTSAFLRDGLNLSEELIDRFRSSVLE